MKLAGAKRSSELILTRKPQILQRVQRKASIQHKVRILDNPIEKPESVKATQSKL